MKTPFTVSFLFRSLLLASFSSLVACSSVLQAIRLSKPSRQHVTEMVADGPPESLQEKALFMNDARQPDTEATFGFPRSMAPGYQWVFTPKESTPYSPGLGYWVVKPNSQR